MSKIKKGIAVFIVFLILVVIYGLITQTQKPVVSGLVIEFQNGTTEPEVKVILENYNMTVNYTIIYNPTTLRVHNESIVCYIQFGDGSGNYTLGKNCITEKDAIIIKNELEMNKKVLAVHLDYVKY